MERPGACSTDGAAHKPAAFHPADGYRRRERTTDTPTHMISQRTAVMNKRIVAQVEMAPYILKRARLRDRLLCRMERYHALRRGRGWRAVLLLALWMTTGLGCSPRIRLLSHGEDPLCEYTLEGTGRQKVLVIPIRGVLSDVPRRGWVGTRPSVVAETAARLRKAEKDDRIRAVVLKIDSPGGAVTAGDLLYHEIQRFKERTGAGVVVAMMNVAASGAYYISLPADHILAHPTTVTGSVGVVFLQPEITGFMDKIGLDLDVYKTGRNKDMGTLFRKPTDEERRIMEGLIDHLGHRFLALVRRHRPITDAALETIATARIFLAEEALALGMIDEIGYLDDALARARTLAGLPSDARVVVYRRSEIADDTVYGAGAALWGGGRSFSIFPTGAPEAADWGRFETGFHYLWYPGAAHE
ncbi:MAG: signal peptide peptidase SppA [Desulfococcus multivorans]|uniref:signal peptide peptidase SppA n=1 Tax=Desulfococcus sp. TaxID=2025834 RepID=UPI002A4B53DD|nr:signal peptide peptidase SppA [Desulfococcus multivorans]